MENDLSSLNKINFMEIAAAGPRYSPAIDPLAPNIQIRDMESAIETLSLSDKFRDRVRELESQINERWDSLPGKIIQLYANIDTTPKKCAELLSNLRHQKSPPYQGILTAISDTVRQTLSVSNERRRALWNELQNLGRESAESQAINAELENLRRLNESMSATSAFTRSTDFLLINNNRLLLLGEWGTGKTHLLCDLTRSRMARGLPTLLVLAHRLPVGIAPLRALCVATKLAGPPSTLLKNLNELGKNHNGRALIIIDGINEGDRTQWRKHIEPIGRKIAKYPNVAMILSCRTPFDKQVITDDAAPLYVKLLHTGFEEVEFDAQREFFSYYKIPIPQIPLLAPEFSRPLFLKIMCQTISGRTSKKKKRAIHELASGQKSMTKLLEDFVSHIGAPIEAEFGLSGKACWRLLKGVQVASGSFSGVAPTMAANLRDYLTNVECEAAVRKVVGLKHKTTIRRFVRRLIADGLLTEDLALEGKNFIDVIRLPYQRFSDHLVCRHLLERYLDTTSSNTVRRSFFRNRPLGRIFEIDQWGGDYRMPGLASAIMLEFPERVKRIAPNDERELLYYLPKNRRRLAPCTRAFLEGLLWRDVASFSTQTEQIIRALIATGPQHIQFQLLEILVTLATRPAHPLSAEKLYENLSRLTLVQRDLWWSEFLRGAHRESVVYRIMGWIENSAGTDIDSEMVGALIWLCASFLTTTHRELRDKATKSLVLLGQQSPKDLFAVALRSLKFNDPYVPERLLAASYGLLMRHWAYPSPELLDRAPSLARDIYDAMFAKNAPFATKHILMRDYALGVIELARKIDSTCLRRRRLGQLSPPFTNPPEIASPSAISDDACTGANSAIQMDFGNYTLGRLVSDRSNYDFDHEEYKDVLRQVKYRVLDLGYDETKFELIDREIATGNFNLGRSSDGTKIDRYGKKYSWIAFFEVAGMRADAGTLPDRDNPRISDCDIDPSFPAAPETWKPTLAPLFAGKFGPPQEWLAKGIGPSYNHLLQMDELGGISGGWALLDGYVGESATDDPREVFSFLRGVFVKVGDRAELRSKFLAREYPGNSAIPNPHEDYYTFAGEIPWSPKFASMLRGKNRSAKPDVREVFSDTVTDTIRKRSRNLTAFEKLRLGFTKVKLSFLGEDRDNSAISNPLEDEEPPLPKYVEVPRYRKVPGIRAEIPVFGFSWESYHSVENQGGAGEYLAPAITELLDLRNQPNCLDLCDRKGRPASLYRTFGTDSGRSRSHLLYIRVDLLDTYLAATDQVLVWMIWGERNFNYKYFESVRDELQNEWSAHAHIHKSFIERQNEYGDRNPATG